MSPGFPISRSATFVWSLTPLPCERTDQISLGNRGSWFVVAQFLYPCKLRCLDSLGSHATHPRRWTVQIRSGNCVSWFQPAQASHLWKPWFATLRDLLTRITLFGRLRSYQKIVNHDFLMQRFYTSKISNGKIPTPPGTLTSVLPRSTARIRSRDFENHKVSIFYLHKTMMTQISRWLLLCTLGLKPCTTCLDLMDDEISSEI